MIQDLPSGGAADGRASALCFSGKIFISAEPLLPLLRLIKERSSAAWNTGAESTRRGPLWNTIRWLGRLSGGAPGCWPPVWPPVWPPPFCSACLPCRPAGAAGSPKAEQLMPGQRQTRPEARTFGRRTAPMPSPARCWISSPRTASSWGSLPGGRRQPNRPVCRPPGARRVYPVGRPRREPVPPAVRRRICPGLSGAGIAPNGCIFPPKRV